MSCCLNKTGNTKFNPYFGNNDSKERKKASKLKKNPKIVYKITYKKIKTKDVHQTYLKARTKVCGLQKRIDVQQ